MRTKTELKYLFLVIVVFIAACIETDIYLPAFADMMTWFSATEGSIQKLLSWNFFGICLSCPFYGPISDAFGRKKPLLIALGMFLAGSLLTVFAQTMDQMLIGRVLQGLGSGGCFTLGTAIIFDAFQKERAITAVNSLNTIIPMIMAGAPMLGGYLNSNFGFRSNFLAIAVFVLASLLTCVLLFQETLPKEKRTTFRVKPILADFRRACCSLPFLQLTIVISLLFSGYIAFLSGSSVLYVVEFGMNKAIFPFIQAAILGGWLLGSLLLKRSIAKWGIPSIKRAGLIFTAIGGLGLGMVALVLPRDPYIQTLFMTICAFGANWIIGLYFPEAMEILPEIKGVTASLLTSARILIAALIVGLTSALYNATVYPMAAVVFFSVLLTLPLILLYERRKAKTSAIME